MKQSKKDLIIELHSAVRGERSRELEKEFPALFKGKALEVGKWYKHRRFLHFYNGGFGDYVTYGFREDGSFCDKMGFHNYDSRVLATDIEVETALIKEFEKNNKPFKNYALNNNIFEGCLFGWNGNEPTTKLFDNGKWATIIETITREEAEKLLGRIIN